MTDFPIKLRNVVIHPTIVYPHQDIGIKVIIILESIGCTTVRIVLLIAVDTERRNPEFHPRLALANCFMDFLDQDIDIVTSPISLIGITTAIFCKGQIIRKIYARSRIRIEIVVHVERIHIVTGNDIADNLADILAVFRQSRIEIQLTAILQEQLRMFVVRMNR